MDKIVSSILLEYLKPVDGRFQHGLLKNYVNRMTSPHPSSGPKESNWITSSCSDVVSGVVSRPFPRSGVPNKFTYDRSFAVHFS